MHSKTAPISTNKKGDFLTFWHELVILRGSNMGEIGAQQLVYNSAQNLQRPVEKLLKTANSSNRK